MKELERPKYYWNYNTCKEEALKYKKRWEFGKNCKRAYNHSLKNVNEEGIKWIDVFFPK